MVNPLAETYLNEANKLDGSNFINWKFKMQTLMEGYGVWMITKGDEAKPVATAGGTAAQIQDWDKRENKAKVWDSLIIETAMKDYYNNDLEEMIAAIQKNVTDSWSDEVPTWENCSTDALACPTPYADESISLACNWAYKDAGEDTVLKDDYFFSRLPTVETQLAKGGVRLAATLNRIFK